MNYTYTVDETAILAVDGWGEAVFVSCQAHRCVSAFPHRASPGLDRPACDQSASQNLLLLRLTCSRWY